MGISPAQFWAQSQNGKAMLRMLAERENTELVRDICEWLVVVYREDLAKTAMSKGATQQQAKMAAWNATEDLRSMAEGLNDRNLVAVSTEVVDKVFRKYFVVSAEKYAEAMLWFANELRRRVSPDLQV